MIWIPMWLVWAGGIGIVVLAVALGFAIHLIRAFAGAICGFRLW